MNVHLTAISSNVKTGPIPVSTSGAETCPNACPLKKSGCYADSGPLAIHWKAVTTGKRGVDWNSFVQSIRKLSNGQLWRHNQAGDLPGESDSIDVAALAQLVAANKGKRGFTYTHKPVIDNPDNARAVKTANDNGFTINLSGNNLAHADQLFSLTIGPVVAIVPNGTPDVSETPNGNKVVICPAQTRDNVTCAKCGLCAKSNRSFIVGFLPHGSGAKKAGLIANS